MRSRNAVTRDSGFALILALLALLLMTFLALTLATTTRTDLQISTNYRWSQAALYNAEAGLEAGRAVLANLSDGQLVLPFARPNTWNPETITPPYQTPGAPFVHLRNFENAGCDQWGNGVGYGAVLVDPSNPAAPFNEVNTLFGERLNGTFTLWVRRDLKTDGVGLRDEPSGEQLVLLAEGQAPFSTGGTTGPFARANAALRRLELKLTIREGCKASGPQASQTGFSDCEVLP